MPTFYSNHYTAAGAGETSKTVPHPKVPVTIDGAKLQIKTARISDPSDAAAAADVLRFCTLPSRARVHRVYASAGAAWTGGTMDLGLYLSGADNDGAVVDADLFASALDIATGFGITEAMVESAVLADEDRGKTLWELAAVGAASYTTDPAVDFDVCGLLGGVPAGPGDVIVEVWYTLDG